jgi:hypothetical protein
METTKYTSHNIYLEYVNVMNEYLLHYTTNSEKYLKPANDNAYLLLNGLDTLTHVFNFLLWHTLDLALVVENIRQAILYYTQFIDQLEENIMYDLNLSSNSASIFVYKKTIWGLKNAAAKEETTVQVLENAKQLILTYRSIVDLFIQDIANIISPANTISPANIISKTTELAQGLNANVCDTAAYHAELVNVNFFIKHITSHMHIKSYDYIYLFLTKYKHCRLTPENLLGKKAHVEYNERLNQWPINKFIKWLVAT